jgi:hypothetical protein
VYSLLSHHVVRQPLLQNRPAARAVLNVLPHCAQIIVRLVRLRDGGPQAAQYLCAGWTRAYNNPHPTPAQTTLHRGAARFLLCCGSADSIQIPKRKEQKMSAKPKSPAGLARRV